MLIDGVNALAILTVMLCAATVIAPRFSSRACAAAIAADLSPLWLLLPSVGFLASLRLTPQSHPLVTGLQLFLLATQVGLSGWVIYRHRRWLWIAAPFVLALFAWIGIGIMISAVAGATALW
jgi:hypothetical protein